MMSFGMILLVGLAVIGFGVVALIVAAVVASTKKDSQGPRLPDSEELGAEGRKLLKPLRVDRTEIMRILAQNPDKPHIQALGAEVLKDVDELLERAGSLALRASSLKKLTKGRTKAELAAKDLKSKIKDASSEQEKSAYEDALAAKQGELASYSKVDEARAKIEAAIYQAHARVSEIKSLLIASAVQSGTQTQETEELRRMVDRLQSMKVSLDEAESLLQES